MLSICAQDRPANRPGAQHRHVAEYGRQRRQVSVCGWQTKVAPFYATEKERRFSGFTPRPRQAFRSADQPRSAIVRNRAPGSAAARPRACPALPHACDPRARRPRAVVSSCANVWTRGERGWDDSAPSWPRAPASGSKLTRPRSRRAARAARTQARECRRTQSTSGGSGAGGRAACGRRAV